MKKATKVLWATVFGGPLGLGLSLALAKDDPTYSPTVVTQTPQKKYTTEELKFCISIASYMMHVDGNAESSEISLLQNDISELKKYNYPDTEILELSNLLNDPPEISVIVKMYNAIKDKNVSKYEELIDNIARADGLLEEEEKVFAYKMSLLFNGIDSGSIYKIIPDNFDITEKAKKYPVINYITLKEVKKNYKNTIPSFDDYFLLHPANDKELISISNILTSDFVRDKDTEVLEAMRIAGAKRVLISLIKHDYDEHKIDQTLQVGVKVTKTVDIDVKEGFKMSGLDDIKENEFIEAQFKGKMNGIFAKRNFIDQSIWVKNDSKLSWLFNARFQPNQVTYFKWDVEYSKIAEKMLSAQLAAKCGVAKVAKVNSKAALEINSEKLSSIKKLFIAEF